MQGFFYINIRIINITFLTVIFMCLSVCYLCARLGCHEPWSWGAENSS